MSVFVELGLKDEGINYDFQSEVSLFLLTHLPAHRVELILGIGRWARETLLVSLNPTNPVQTKSRQKNDSLAIEKLPGICGVVTARGKAS